MTSITEDLLYDINDGQISFDIPSLNMDNNEMLPHLISDDDSKSHLPNGPTHPLDNHSISLNMSSSTMVTNDTPHPLTDSDLESLLINSHTHPPDNQSISSEERSNVAKVNALVISLNEQNHKIGELTTTVATLVTACNEQKHEIVELKTAFNEQNHKIVKLEEELACMKQILHQLVESNKTTKINNQQIVQPISTSDNADFRLSTDEILLNDSSENNNQNIDMPINQNENAGMNVLSKSNPTTNVESQIHTNYPTTTVASDLNLNGHLSTTSDKILSKKKQKKVQVGQSCREVIYETTVESSELNHTTDCVTSAIATSSFVLNEPQQQHNNFTKQNLSSSNSVDNQLWRYMDMTNVTPAAIDGSIQCSLLHSLHPLQAKLINKTDRFTELKDCRKETPVLTIRSDGPLENISMEIAMVSSSRHGNFSGIYQFKETNDKGVVTSVDIIHRNIGSCNDKSKTIELTGLELKKVRNQDLELERGTVFTLKSYPSGKKINIPIKGQKKLTNEYNLKEQRLFIRFFRDGMPIPDQPIFFSNPIIDSSDAQINVAIHPPIHSNQTNTVPIYLYCTPRINMKVSDDQGYQLSQITAENTDQRVSNIGSSSLIEPLSIFQEQDQSEIESRQKRKREDEASVYRLGLPITRVSKISKNNNEQ
ncbi:unnamed protein product [Adineta steineri]|uniref:Uncharacterized protein n=1 Tax=Adineta steineri TaxID=433720 RepID=A0A819FHT9_9BILA|nr:unnamed protein product [Adineta steineri]CAF3866112.1 unnamed protein product [Adineta steineri]